MKIFKQPTEKEWKRLYEFAVKVKELAPWEWMYEDQIFGVQNPEAEEIGFVSIMGIAGEHFGISFYDATCTVSLRVATMLSLLLTSATAWAMARSTWRCKLSSSSLLSMALWSACRLRASSAPPE